MIDARKQVKTALKTVCQNVLMSYPAGKPSFPLIVYAEMENLPVNRAYVRLRWRISVYCSTFEALNTLVDSADTVMSETLGYTRTYKTPDSELLVSTDVYRCQLDYSGLVNTKTNGVIKYST